MPAPILSLPVKTDASNRLVIATSAATAGSAGTIGSATAPLPQLQVKTQSDLLVVRING